MVRGLFAALLNMLVPPRTSERLLQRFTLAQAHALMTERGLPYHDPRVTALVWEIKYFANPGAVVFGAELMAPHILELAAQEIGVALLVPVPMHPLRRKERGHHPGDLLCRALLPHLKSAVEYAPQALVRVVNTPKQQGLERAERLKNVAGSMVASSAVKDRVCIVVDDVTTTGATLKEAQRALRKAGASTVHTIALAYS